MFAIQLCRRLLKHPKSEYLNPSEYFILDINSTCKGGKGVVLTTFVTSILLQKIAARICTFSMLKKFANFCLNCGMKWNDKLLAVN